MKHLVKRAGHTEPYDSRKLYASVYAACRSDRASEQQSEAIARTVTSEVEEKILKLEAVSSLDIVKHAAAALKKLNPDAAYLYETHRDIS